LLATIQVSSNVKVMKLRIAAVEHKDECALMHTMFTCII